MRIASLGLLLGVGFAAQNPVVLPFNEGQQLAVSLSDTDINRISVDQDKIIHFSCEPGTCSLSNNADDPTGSVYLNVAASAPSTMYLSTANGHNLSLVVTPVNTSGVTVLLEPLSGGMNPAPWEKDSDYEAMLTTLMKDFMNGSTIDGFSRFFCSDDKNSLCNVASIEPYKGLTLTPVQEIVGQRLMGIEYQVHNENGMPLTLYESAFYGNGVRAVAISNPDIAANGDTSLYMIRSHS